MRYYTLHHGTYWFQVRVPVRLRERYGNHVRIDLQTADAVQAKQLALRLAADWFARFSLNLAGEESLAPAESLAPLGGGTPVACTTVGDRMTEAFAYWRDLVKDRPPRTVLDFGATAELFDLRVAKRLAAITRLDIASFRDSLLRDGLAPATVRTRLGAVGTILQAQVDGGRLPANVSRGIRVPRGRVKGASRIDFSAEQLERVFGSRIYTAGHRPRGGGGEAAAWLPVLGLATGARLEELCQLRLSDIEDGPGAGLLVHIIADGDETTVKTDTSVRTVPVHSAVLECGFAEYVEQRRRAKDKWLFPALTPDTLGTRGGQFSKWFGRWLRSERGCHITDKRLVFHSFRHTFKTICRAAGVEEEVHDALTGHAGSVGRGYGSVPIATLVTAIESLRFPVALPRIQARR